MSDFDVVIIGAGMAGAGVAAELSGAHKVLLLEAESQPGYHATGRSVAFWTESYGGPDIQPLTSASGPLLAQPGADMGGASFLFARGAYHIGTAENTDSRDSFMQDFVGSGVILQQVDHCALSSRIPGVRPQWQVGVAEDSCCDIDVAALHSAYLTKARRKGAVLRTGCQLVSAQWRQGHWHLQTSQGSVTTDIIVNAAGAWADIVAQSCNMAPIGIQPLRRTVVQLAVTPSPDISLPLVIALDGSFYFKPAPGGRIWLSPHDETPSKPVDAAADEWDVALAIDRFQHVVDWQITNVEHRWAGLRSFAPDRIPIFGPDPANPAFIWAAGQGGFGIQTAPAASRLLAALIQGCDSIEGLDVSRYLPDRLR